MAFLIWNVVNLLQQGQTPSLDGALIQLLSTVYFTAVKGENQPCHSYTKEVYSNMQSWSL